MTDSPVLIERKDGVAKVILNRPHAGNAITLELAHRLMQVAIACDEDPSIRCVLLTGQGRLFCGGGDVDVFVSAGDKLPEVLKEMTAYLHMALARFARMEKPLVVAVNGPAAGAGLSLAICGDLVLASASAHFTLAYTGIGLSPDAGSTWVLPRLIGMRRTQELVLTNRRLTAEEAAAMGLVTRAVADDLLMNEATTLASELAAGPTGAFGRARRLLLSSFETSLETQMELEARDIAACAHTAQGKEGIAAFLEKRKPSFI